MDRFTIYKMYLKNIDLPSNRKFGLFFSTIFFLIAAYFHWNSLSYSSLFIVFGICFLIITILNEKLLLPLNKLWMYIGFLLGMIIRPVIMAVIFLLIFTPIAIVFKLFGRDELRLKRKDKSSYWVLRKPNARGYESFKEQF
jgi:hypothetical protein